MRGVLHVDFQATGSREWQACRRERGREKSGHERPAWALQFVEKTGRKRRYFSVREDRVLLALKHGTMHPLLHDAHHLADGTVVRRLSTRHRSEHGEEQPGVELAVRQ